MKAMEMEGIENMLREISVIKEEGLVRDRDGVNVM